ncbi:MAG: heme-binding domain-containing protein, partial [Bacteroidota bacterium]
MGLLAAVGIGVILQFVPVKGVGNNPTARYKVDGSPEVEAVLRRACFDCHSNETQWPLYARLAPASWLLARDVNKGRARINMSDWGDVDDEERAIDKKDMWEQVEAGQMPPW